MTQRSSSGSEKDAANSQSSDVKKQFVYLATEISNHFPELDIRFNLRTDTNEVRCSIPDFGGGACFEFVLEVKRTKQLLHEAVFMVKEMTNRFDA